ncbi:MAG: hypothetical protein AB7E49_01420 [Campylobacterales bacterium]
MAKRIGGALLATLEHSINTAEEDAINPSAYAVGSAILRVRRKMDRLAKNDNGLAFALFIVCEDIDSHVGRNGFGRKSLSWHLNRTDSMQSVNQALVLVSKDGGSITVSDPHESMDVQFEKVISLRLGDSPAILFQPDNGRVVADFFPEGVVNGEPVELEAEVGAKLLDPVFLKGRLDRFDAEVIKGYELGRLWEKATNYWPISQAERTIQDYMFIWLRSPNKDVDIIPEYINEDGRADLIVQSVVGEKLEKIVVELKVLRSFSSTGSPCRDPENLKNSQEVVIQTHSYRNKLAAKAGIACLYDMRKPSKKPTPDLAIETAEGLSTEKDVSLRVIIVPATLREKRQSEATEKECSLEPSDGD